MFENVKNAVNQIFGPVVPAATRPSEGRVPHAGNLRDPQGRNIPIPHLKREWGRSRNIGTLPSVVGDITGTSGPRRTMFPQIINPQLFQESARPRPFQSDGAILARAVDFNEQSTIALDSGNRGIVSGRPRIKVSKSRDERLAQGPGSVDNHLGTLDEVNKYPGRGTDVLPDRPYARDMPLSGQGVKGPITWAILFELLSRFLGEEGATARMRQMGFGGW